MKNPPLRLVDAEFDAVELAQVLAIIKADVTCHDFGHILKIGFSNGIDRTIITLTPDGALEFWAFEGKEWMCRERTETAAPEGMEQIRRALMSAPADKMPMETLS